MENGLIDIRKSQQMVPRNPVIADDVIESGKTLPAVIAEKNAIGLFAQTGKIQKRMQRFQSLLTENKQKIRLVQIVPDGSIVTGGTADADNAGELPEPFLQKQRVFVLMVKRLRTPDCNRKSAAGFTGKRTDEMIHG